MRVSKAAGLLALLCFSLHAFAQSSEIPEWKYLYRLSGHGHSAFILGGAHAGLLSQASQVSACVLRAADEAEVLITEGNVMDVFAEAPHAQKALPQLSEVIEGLSADQQTTLRRIIGKLKPEQVSVMQGAQAAMSVALGKYLGGGVSLAAGSDFPLLVRAVRAIKPIGALESSEDQMGVVQKISLGVWRQSLAQSLDLVGDAEAAKAAAKARKDMMLALMRGEEAPILRTRALAEAEWETLLTEDRNASLTERIVQMLDKLNGKSVFFAMGGAHLPGPTGIVQRLRGKGYELEPMCR